MIPSIYLNLEDDVAAIITRIKREKSGQVVLVCPKRCFLFNDSINLRLLKKQTDLLKKEVFILTMDERGQAYAKEAGFQLKFLPKKTTTNTFSDIHVPKKSAPEKPAEPEKDTKNSHDLIETVKGITGITKLWDKSEEASEEQPEKEEEKVEARHKAVKSATKIAVPQVAVEDTIFPKELEEAHKIRRTKAWNQKAVTMLVALSLILILAVVFVILPKATVVVYPKSEPLTRDFEISLSTSVQNPDASRMVLPAVKVDQTLDVADKFQSQGKKEVGNKASGMVQIYNFTQVPINLKSGTTVLTVGSKSYNLVNDISLLKPTVYRNAKTKEVDVNSLAAPVEIVAAEGGESSNLPAGTRMEISNQVFGSKPQFLFAKTATAVDGGTSRFLSVVTDRDVNSSKNALEGSALQKIQNDLSGQGLTLAESSYVLQDLQFSTDKPVNTESPSFGASAKIKITGIAFKTQELKQLIFDRISQTLANNKTLAEGDQPLSFKFKMLDINNELGVLAVHFEGRAVYNIDLNDIAPQLLGKTQSQVNEILKSKTEIDRIDITLAPAWQKNFPWFAKKINVLTETKLSSTE